MTETSGPSCVSVSIVIIALNEGVHLQSTLEGLQATVPAGTEIVIIDDGSTDGCTDFLDGNSRNRSLRSRLSNSEQPATEPRPEGAGVRLVRSNQLGVAKARNFGASLTSGDVIVFADAHITLPEGWLPPLLEALRTPGVAAVAPAIYDVSAAHRVGYGLSLKRPDLEATWLARQSDAPSAVPVLPGCCLAMRRDAFLATGGFDHGLLSRGGVDNELGVRLALLGYELRVAPAVSVGHLFRKVSPYPVAWSTFLHNRIRLALLHLGPARRAKVLEALKGHGSFQDAMAIAEKSDVDDRRRELESRRVHDDNWFFERFALPW